MKTKDKIAESNERKPDEDVDFYEEEHSLKAPGIQVVGFRIGKEWYAADIGRIIEVITATQLAELPSSPSHIAGITNLRGDIVSVTDPKKLFGLENTPKSNKSRILVVSCGNIESGLLVDEVSQVLDVEHHQIDPPLTTLDAEKAQYLKGEFMRLNQLVTILDIENILTKTKMKSDEIP